MAVRFPFMAMLMLALACTWYGTYYLARAAAAQPVRFAFGGEAKPKGLCEGPGRWRLLALIACLGLAKLGHAINPGSRATGMRLLLFLGYCLRPGAPGQGSVRSAGRRVGHDAEWRAGTRHTLFARVARCWNGCKAAPRRRKVPTLRLPLGQDLPFC
jgi:hypothetical protein